MRGAGAGLALLGLVGAVALCPCPAAAQPAACAQEAASIHRAESQLPRLDVAPPGDQQIVCITLETNILFVRRLAAHLARCPRSPLSRDGETWKRVGTDYTDQFTSRRCKPAVRSYRG